MVKFLSTKITKDNLPLVIGFFDCLHKGHMQLFKDLKPKKFNILTFINIPHKNTNFVYNNQQRINNLQSLNPKNVYILDLATNNMPHNDFIDLLTNKIKPSIVIIGNDFKFGKDRLGTINELKKHLKLEIVKINSKYKTSLVKKEIQEGNIKKLNQLLFKPYTIIGEVIKGKQFGRKFGYCTANVILDKDVIQPKTGSYSGFTFINHKQYKSAIFIRDKIVESHLFNFDQNIYHKQIVIQLLKYHKTFNQTNSFDELKQLIAKKVKEIKASF